MTNAMQEPAKHTPGPWRVGATKTEVTAAINTPAEYGIVASMGRDFSNAGANARLIAKAPEMLETLQATHVLLSQFILPNYPHDSSMRDNIRALLHQIRAATEIAQAG